MDLLIKHMFLGESDALRKKWLVRAYSVDDASIMVIEECKDLLAELDASVEGDVDIDLKFTQLDEKDVVEI